MAETWRRLTGALLIVGILVLFLLGCPVDPAPPVSYHVIFEPNGGSLVDPQTVIEGGTVSEPSAPTTQL